MITVTKKEMDVALGYPTNGDEAEVMEQFQAKYDEASTRGSEFRDYFNGIEAIHMCGSIRASVREEVHYMEIYGGVADPITV